MSDIVFPLSTQERAAILPPVRPIHSYDDHEREHIAALRLEFAKLRQHDRLRSDLISDAFFYGAVASLGLLATVTLAVTFFAAAGVGITVAGVALLLRTVKQALAQERRWV